MKDNIENVDVKESEEQIEEVLEDAVEEAVEVEAEEVDELTQLKEQLEEKNDQFVRLNAEFQNYKRRVEKEKADIFKYGSEKIVTDLLMVIDNFDRASDSFEENEQTKSIIHGIEMIQNNFIDILKKHGVEEIEALDRPFDHDFHHAVMSEDSEDHDEETVVEVFQKGYTLNQKVIRPAMVKVSK